MRRVLHVLESCAAGGIETTFLTMLRVWRQSPPWAEHHVLACATGALEHALREHADSLTVAFGRDELERAILWPCDAVHVLFERCAYTLVPVLIGARSTPLIYGKGYDMAGMFRVNDGWRWQPDASLMTAADAVTFTTDGLAAAYGAVDDELRGRAKVLGKAADVARFLRVALPEIGHAPRIVCVANLHRRKRLGDLVRALAIVRRVAPDARLRFVGGDEGRETERLRSEAAALGLADAVELVGRREDVAADIESAQVFALPSGCEGVPTAMLEAMAAGRPVVVTDTGHVRQVVRDGVEGYVVPPGDLGALADRLIRLLGDPVGHAEMARAARVRACEHGAREVSLRLRAAIEAAWRRPVVQGAAA